jgi:hypothetical protein
MDTARHVTGYRSYSRKRVKNVLDDVATTIHQSLTPGLIPRVRWLSKTRLVASIGDATFVVDVDVKGSTGGTLDLTGAGPGAGPGVEVGAPPSTHTTARCLLILYQRTPPRYRY